jgi:hypothetical protein
MISACESNPELAGALPTPDGEQFVHEVYPLLLRDCAFSGCHGAPERFLRIVGPGRVRLQGIAPRDEPRLEEVMLSYDRARATLSTTATPEQSLFLRKPLALAAGGQTHEGSDAFGRNVYASKADPRYSVLLEWARSFGEAPNIKMVVQLSADAQAERENLELEEVP